MFIHQGKEYLQLPPIERQARLIESREIAPEIRHFVFAVEDVEQFAFAPGQFVSLSELFEGKKITRAYSLASMPDGNRFELCLNRVKDGRFSPYLFSMQPGDVVPMKGPVGTFTLRNEDRDALLIATGTGIAPIRGILQEAMRRELPNQYTLLFGVRYEHSLLYRTEFEAMAAANPKFRFEPTLTQPGKAWTGRRGRVQLHLDELLGGRKDVDVYICGLHEMVDGIRRALKEQGFERTQIIYEKYD